jgi:hypothetical protein
MGSRNADMNLFNVQAKKPSGIFYIYLQCLWQNGFHLGCRRKLLSKQHGQRANLDPRVLSGAAIWGDNELILSVFQMSAQFLRLPGSSANSAFYKESVFSLLSAQTCMYLFKQYI